MYWFLDEISATLSTVAMIFLSRGNTYKNATYFAKNEFLRICENRDKYYQIPFTLWLGRNLVVHI